MNRINSGDMPPEEQPRPKPDDSCPGSRMDRGPASRCGCCRGTRRTAKKWPFASSRAKSTPTPFATCWASPSTSPIPPACRKIPDWQGFQRIGSVLTLSPGACGEISGGGGIGVERGVVARPAAEARSHALDAVRIARLERFRKGISGPRHRGQSARGPGAQQRRLGRSQSQHQNGRRLPRAGESQRSAPRRRAAPRLRLYAGDISRVLLEQDVEAPEDQPVTIEFRTHLPVGNHPILIVNAVPGPNPEARRSRASGTPNAFTNLQSRVPWQMKFTDDDGQPIVPFLLLDYVEWEGPILESWPTPAHQRIFFGGEQATKDLDYARQIVARFAERAWRRPVQPAEVDRLVKLVEQAQQLGDNFRDVGRRPRCWPSFARRVFLYLEEGKCHRAVSRGSRIGSWPRGLSYFLWSSMPDQRLFDLARAGKLHEPDTLRAEVRAHAGRSRRPPSSPRRFRTSGCNCARSACSRPTRCSIPITTSIWKRA